MTLRHFKIYVTVYNEKNMTAAAKKLFMAQPSVSQAIKELETHYNTVLFERFPKELHATSSGELLYEYASHILQKNAELEDLMKQGAAQHILRIGANDTVGSSLLDDYIEAFQKSHPLEEIQVHITRSFKLSDMLRTNDLDFILTDEFKDAPDLTAELIHRDSLVFVAGKDYTLPSDHLLSAELLSKHHLLLREPGTYIRDDFDRFMTESGYPIKAYWESISFDILINAALRNMGIALLPESAVLSYLQAGQLVQYHLPGFSSSQKIVLAYQKNKYITPAMEDFFNLCRS